MEVCRVSKDLADLTADVKALLDDYAWRGALGVGDGPAPSAAAGSDWAGLAAEARQASDDVTGAEAMARVLADLGDCRRCGLCTGRSSIVFGVGDESADLMIIGEGPGYHEDRTGEPFVGPAGEMLDKMLLNVLKLERRQVYISNIVKCRPPKNRNPLPDEVGACLPFLHRQIEAVQPKVLLVLGSVALKALLNASGGIMRSRGIWTKFGDTPVMPTFHPAYLLRTPADKRKTWHDLIEVNARYEQLNGKR
jgi:uracil-DNA glycosylase